jgi:hypothetical protein
MKKFGKFEAKEGVTLNANGKIRTNPNSPEYGSIMFIEEDVKISNGFINKAPKVGFISGKVTDLTALLPGMNPNDYRVIKLETIEPEEGKGWKSSEFTNKKGEHFNPTSLGSPIFWKTEVVAINSVQDNELVTRDSANAEAVADETFSAEQIEA